MRGGGRHMGDWLKPAVFALQLLTRVPIPIQVPWQESVGRRSVVFYPLAGAVVGWLLGAAFWLLPGVLPALPAAALLTALWVWVTGALHLDGWMDTADALGSHRSQERMREIMKDPHVGAMGVAAGALLVVMKTAFIYSLVEAALTGSRNLVAALSMVPVLARAFVPWAVVGWPYAGGAKGMGAVLRTSGWRHAWASAVLAAVLILFLLIGFSTGDVLQLLPIALGGGLLSAAAGTLGAALLARRIGGLTGDTYGALIEGLELVLLLALAALGGGAASPV